ncbi:putative nucleic acid-binding protein [Virgibacillus natechei]|uniref:Ribonuclease VapC n=1 Tax=Virgibacillus natechei TaxID=1216297 RepID=A0ABS4IEM1_9BACI|nr:PIN domain-containing protein [Virgibacillus natechei]MBP1969345.1 putative nucleic acid-binding protein [Virgibacillus natechei]UZD12494.1 PIN domain-containing protein [Virgibacillus natechei]
MKNNRCFVDTSALIALNHAGDQKHAASREISLKLKDNQLMISDAVINETYNILRYRLGFQKAAYFLKMVLRDNTFIIVDVTPSIRADTLQLLEQYNDHKISYCDALSVAIMKERQIHKIFSFDYHFTIMGVEVVQ